jgi:hypothetical protein
VQEKNLSNLQAAIDAKKESLRKLGVPAHEIDGSSPSAPSN